MEDFLKEVEKRGSTHKTDLKTIKEFLKEHNQKVAEEMISKGKNPQIYEVKHLEEGEIAYDITRINSGSIGSEKYMTKGHEHIKKTPEVYYLISGGGHVIAKNFVNGKKKKIRLKKGKFIYVPKEYGHRTVNTGKKKLIFFTVSQADAGHNYEISKKRGF